MTERKLDARARGRPVQDQNADRYEADHVGDDPPEFGWVAGDFIKEADAYAAFGHLLEDKELRHARQSGRLGFMRRKRTIFYRRDELEAFVSGLLRQDYVEPCPQTISRGSTAPSSVGLPSGNSKRTDDYLSMERRQRALRLLS